ncbi:hydrogenase nickel insertion protein HypA [Dehalogenimonas lykanthroporepellens BL-DC-9]|jgi:hydrogenase nickel incorporation protein HypA/HybF|nr:hydrogenase nickel insertion protein HypA [Dehalogenimonas lykanthroporepellens BL-DC-9]
MHEMAVTQSLLDIVIKEAEKAGAKKVNAVNLVIGELSGLVDDSVQFYFDFLTKDTIADGSRLVFRRVPARMKCRACEAEFSPEPDEWVCPQCDQWQAEVVAGKEFYIDSIEVDDDADKGA